MGRAMTYTATRKGYLKKIGAPTRELESWFAPAWVFVLLVLIALPYAFWVAIAAYIVLAFGDR